MTPTLDYDGEIAILDLGDDENRFSPSSSIRSTHTSTPSWPRARTAW